MSKVPRSLADCDYIIVGDAVPLLPPSDERFRIVSVTANILTVAPPLRTRG
jgi:hypothetical protein